MEVSGQFQAPTVLHLEKACSAHWIRCLVDCKTDHDMDTNYVHDESENSLNACPLHKTILGVEAGERSVK
jgi:hypothetical protein